MEIKVGVVCDRGLNPKRPVNQDSYLSVPEHGLFAVFDGVGGQQAGEVASHMAAETVEESLAHINASTSRELIDRAIQFANRDIYERAESDPAYKTMATTVALIHIEGNRATIAHVGDSRVYRLQDGFLHRETIDHTDYNDAQRAGISLNLPGSGGNVINRALGVEPDVEIESKIINVTDGTRLLLCSDGIYRHLADEEIAGVLAQVKDPQAAADELKRLVLSRGADDNLTAIIVQMGRARIGRVIGIDDGFSKQPQTSQPSAASSSSAENRRTANRATPNSRIEVAFKQETAGSDDSPWDWQSGHSTAADDETRGGKSRTFIRFLTLLVCVAAAFYVGLSWPVWFGKPSPGRNVASDTAGRVQAAREAFEKGDRVVAAAELESILASEPQNADARFWSGRVQFAQGEYARAREHFEEAMKAQPKMTDAYLYAAAAQRVLGEKARAEALLEKYVELQKASSSTAPPTMQAPNNNR